MKPVAISALALSLLASTASFAGERTYTLYPGPADGEVWQEIDSALHALVPEGGTISENKSMSSITIAGIEDFSEITAYLDQMNKLASRQFEILTNILVVPVDQAPVEPLILTDDAPRDIGSRFAEKGKLLDYHTMSGITGNGHPFDAGLTSEVSYPMQTQTGWVGAGITAAKISAGARISVTPRYTENGIQVHYRITSNSDSSAPIVALDGEYVAKDGQTIELTERAKEAGMLGSLLEGDAKAAVVTISVKQIASSAPVVE